MRTRFRKRWLRFRILLLLVVFSAFTYLSVTQISFSVCYVHSTSRQLQQFPLEISHFGTKKARREKSHLANVTTAIFTTTTTTSTLPITTTTIVIPSHSSKNVSEDFQKKHRSRKELSCQHLQQLLKIAKSAAKSQLRKENDLGNRAVYFSKIIDENRKKVDIVLKVASLPEDKPETGHFYRYKTALKEIENLKNLEELNWKGVPKFYGACVKPNSILYAVERIEGRPICKGYGTNMSCVHNTALIKALIKTQDPFSSTLRLLSKISCFFYQFERDQVFMEDLSGSNLFYHVDTYDIYVVDADSLIFYGNASINSKFSCKSDKQCPSLLGNYWNSFSLNRKIYAPCRELRGHCVDFVCRGINSSLHVCGIGRWFVTSLRKLIPQKQLFPYYKISKCMTARDPSDRCNFKHACGAFTHEYKKYEESKKLSIEERKHVAFAQQRRLYSRRGESKKSLKLDKPKSRTK